MKDYYRALGVAHDASQEEIKKAFRRLARETHPDANPDNPQAEARFREIAEAYEVLSDPDRRRSYDRGETIDIGGLFSQFGGLDEIFNLFFGTVPAAAPRSGRDVLYEVELTLEEAAFGVAKEIGFETASSCSRCAATGAEPGTAVERCSRCGGTGSLRVARRGLMGSLMSLMPCDVCRGTGEIIRDPCRDCGGSGTRVAPRTMTVDIPAGVSSGTRLRLAGRGEAGFRGSRTGDLYVDLHVAPHDRFVRDGDNLHYRLPVGIAQAALGAEATVPLLDGGEATVDVSAGSQPGSTIRLAGKGVPRLNRRGRGDLIVTVDVVVPAELSREEEEALRAFAEVRGEQTRAARRWRRAR